MSVKPQNLANHARYVPLFHFVLATMLVLYLAWTVRHVIIAPRAQHWVDLMMALAFVIMFTYMRQFPIRVQDRVIRLEETLRLQRLAPDLAKRASEFAPSQFIGLRFASDEEFPALARKVLDEHIMRSADIKKLVKAWRPDYLRA
jgi:Family of unknown function (DUF6526)